MNLENELINQINLFPEGKYECTSKYSDWELEMKINWNYKIIDLEMHYSKPSLKYDFPKVMTKNDPFWAAIFIMVKEGSIKMSGTKSEMSDLFLSHKIALRLMKLKRGQLIWNHKTFTFKARIKQTEKRLFKHIREHCETLVNGIDYLQVNKL